MTTPPPPGSAGQTLGSVQPTTLSAFQFTGTKQLITGVGWLTDITMVTESATAAAKIYIWDNTAASGQVVIALAAAAGGGASHGPGSRGILIRRGAFLQVVTGMATVSAQFWPILTPPE